nr:PREDICTED: trichohyalin-like [Notothenia coriiceps]
MEELREMMRSLLQLQAAGEQQFAREEERRLRRQDGRLARGSTGTNSAAEASKILPENRILMREQKEEMRLVEEARLIRLEEEKKLAEEKIRQERERQLLEELERRKRKEEKEWQREELLKILEGNNRKLKRELERAAAKKLETVNSSPQRHLQRRTEEKEERERELISMTQQMATLMLLQRSRADPAQRERPQSWLFEKSVGIQNLRMNYMKRLRKHRAEWRHMEGDKMAKTVKTLCFLGILAKL